METVCLIAEKIEQEQKIDLESYILYCFENKNLNETKCFQQLVFGNGNRK